MFDRKYWLVPITAPLDRTRPPGSTVVFVAVPPSTTSTPPDCTSVLTAKPLCPANSNPPLPTIVPLVRPPFATCCVPPRMTRVLVATPWMDWKPPSMVSPVADAPPAMLSDPPELTVPPVTDPL